MKLILMGIEWAGKTTLSQEIAKWWEEQTGSHTKFHDHFTKPITVQENPTTLAALENEQIANLVPSLLEKFQRYQIDYHILAFKHDDDMLAINLHYGDAVYAPLYYGYGVAGQYGDRRFMARLWDHEMLEAHPDTVLVMMKASPEVIRRRMHEGPRPKCPFQEADVELVLNRFDEEFNDSLILRRFALDTTTASVAETMKEFVRKIEPLLSEKDALRILRHRALNP